MIASNTQSSGNFRARVPKKLRCVCLIVKWLLGLQAQEDWSHDRLMDSGMGRAKSRPSWVSLCAGLVCAQSV